MSKSLPRFAAPILWGTSQAGGTLLLASSAWMVSGLTSSPFLNGLFPAVGALPVLLNLKYRHSGYWWQIFGVGLLLIFSFFFNQDNITKILLLVVVFFTAFVYGLGQEISMVPIQQSIIARSGASMKKIQLGHEIGVLVGNILTALLFPAIRQFIPALILMLPMAKFLQSSESMPDQLASPNEPLNKTDFNYLCLMQGLVLGSLFGMLALWVREIDGGKCFDFAMILVAYSIGRSLVQFVPKMHASMRYLLIVLLLTSIELIPIAWISVTMFVAIGALVSASDFALVDRLECAGDLPSRWQVLQNSSALGALAGSLALGLICEILSLKIALILVCAGFIGLAIINNKKKVLNSII